MNLQTEIEKLAKEYILTVTGPNLPLLNASLDFKAGARALLKLLQEAGPEFPSDTACARWAWNARGLIAEARIADLEDQRRKHRDDLRTERDGLKAKCAELEQEIEELDSPYCAVCGSCGEIGSCDARSCKYPGVKPEELTNLKEYSAELKVKCAEYEQMLKASAKGLCMHCNDMLYEATDGEAT